MNKYLVKCTMECMECMECMELIVSYYFTSEFIINVRKISCEH